MKKFVSMFFCLFFWLLKLVAQAPPFEKEIQKFDSLDQALPPVSGQILLYGSSTLRLWETCTTDFAHKNLRVVNRGFGGSQCSDANLYFEKVVVPHQPAWLFFYEGDNDINAGKSVDSVFMAMQTFVQKVRSQLPKTRLVLLAIKPSPSRQDQFEKQRNLNRRLWRYVQTQRNVFFIDTFSRMLGQDGKPDPSLFKTDMLHMNTEGYKIWTKQIQKLLKRKG
jgi:lysophospholipase L1-like esterase